MKPHCGSISQDNTQHQELAVSSGQDVEAALKFLASAGDKRESWRIGEDYEWDSQAMVASRRNAKGSTRVNRSCHAPTAPASDVLDALVAPCAGSNRLKQKNTTSESDACSEEEDNAGGAPARSTQGQAEISKGQSASRFLNGCQADGCTKDLSTLTYYHVRNKICDVHIKCDVYTRDGNELRFCQRCGHSHPLNEFDGDKHSCRAQLEKHNARRRKKAGAGAAGTGSRTVQTQRPAAAKVAGGGVGKTTGKPVVTGGATATGPSRNLRRRPSVMLEEDTEEEEEELAAPDVTKKPSPAPALPQDNNQPGTSGPHPLPFIDFEVPNDLLDGFPQSTAGEPSLNMNAVDDLSAWMSAQLAEYDVAAGLTSTHPGGAHAAEFSAASLLAVPGITPAPAMQGDVPAQLPPFALPGVAAPPMTNNAKLATVSLKLFGCTPAELPADLRAQLQSWFNDQVASMEGYLRPGCVHLTVQAMLEPKEGAAHAEGGSKDEKKSCCGKRSEPEGGGTLRFDQPLAGSGVGGIETLVERMLASGEELWRSKTYLIQVGNDIGIVMNGRLRHSWDVSASPLGRALPTVAETSPLFLLAGTPTTIRLRGVNLIQDSCEVVCRSQGHYVPIQYAGCGECKCTGAVSSCCASSPEEQTGAFDEKKCCGCCISKLSQLSLQQEPLDLAATADIGSNTNDPSCCPRGPRSTATIEAAELQSVDVRLDVPQKPGILHVDVICDLFMAPGTGRSLVVDDPEVFAELSALEQAGDVATAAAWSSALGVVFEWCGDKTKVGYALVERTAVRLLYSAVGAGLLATSRYLHSMLLGQIMATVGAGPLPRHLVASFDGLTLLAQVDQASRAATLRRLAALGSQDGSTLLHYAVRSQRHDVLSMVLDWGKDSGMPWRCDIAGPQGMTPLHLACLVKDQVTSSRLLLTLISKCEPGTEAWRSALTDDGQTPADYAAALGRVGLVATFGASSMTKQNTVNGVQSAGVLKNITTKASTLAATEAPATPRRCKCLGPCPCANSAEPCASCTSSSDDEDGCCGGKSGVCCCCSKTEQQVVGPERHPCCSK